MFSMVSAAYPVSASSASVAARTAARTFGPRPGGRAGSLDSTTAPGPVSRSPSLTVTLSQLVVATNERGRDGTAPARRPERPGGHDAALPRWPEAEALIIATWSCDAQARVAYSSSQLEVAEDGS